MKQQKHLEKKEKSILAIGMENTKKHYLILPGLLSKQLIIFKSMAINVTSQEWSIKIISHSDGEELLKLIILGSLMDNGKMERDMDTLDLLIKMVSAFNQNGKMVRK